MYQLVFCWIYKGFHNVVYVLIKKYCRVVYGVNSLDIYTYTDYNDDYFLFKKKRI